MAVPLKKTAMPEQAPADRVHNFNEVALGYTPEMAKEEAARCLNCKSRPCVSGCPVSVNIPDFIACVKAGDYEGAYRKIRATNALPAVCGRVCPQESQCEARCVRGVKGEPVGIGRLERFVSDYHREHAEEATPERPAPLGIRAAVVGSGPAGLTCAGELARRGYDVTVFEALHQPGGVLVYGIPEFRLPKAIVRQEIEGLERQGVRIETGVVVGRTISVDELFKQGFQAVFIGSGAGLPSFMHIEGENLNGVFSANEYLTRVNLMRSYDGRHDTPMFRGRNVAVIGGGNVAMDAARSALRMGAETVSIVYRRGKDELPARREEVEHAEAEGVRFLLLTDPAGFTGDENGWLTGARCVKMRLGEPDASGRPRPVVIEGSEFLLPLDTAIIAVGTSPNPLIRNTTPGLEANRRGCIVADETTATSREGVFAGGDAVSGAATVILAMGAGRNAAAAMDRYLREKNGLDQ